MLLEFDVFFKHFGEHDVGHHIAFAYDVVAELLLQVLFDLIEVDRFRISTWTTIDFLLSFQHLSAERLRKSSVRLKRKNNHRSSKRGKARVYLSELTLHEFDHTGGKREFFSAFAHILASEIVLNHELSEIADHFRGRRDFDHIAQQLIGFDVRVFDVLEL